MNPISLFHPAVVAWFSRSFAAPTAAQAEAWPAIKAGENVLIMAPTGSGKTLAAFLAAIDGLVRQGLESGLTDETQIVYVSPLKALSNDIQMNLEAPLAGIREALRAQGLADVEIRCPFQLIDPGWFEVRPDLPGEVIAQGEAAQGRPLSVSAQERSVVSGGTDYSVVGGIFMLRGDGRAPTERSAMPGSDQAARRW